MIVIATKAELDLVDKVLGDDAYKYYPVIVTGVGGVNICNHLRNVPLDTEIINIGYVGSSNYPIGEIVNVGECRAYHPNVTFDEPVYHLTEMGLRHSAICYTSNDFVLETKLSDCIFDMELVYILALGFKNVKSIKVVSDNLSLHQYDHTTGDTNVKESIE